MGIAKNTANDTSHKGNLAGLSNIAQNAESLMLTFAVKM